MRRTLLTLLWLGLSPTCAWALAPEEARHLLVRTGFDASAAPDYAALDHPAAVRRLLAGVRREALTPPPAWADDPLPDPRAVRDMSDAERKALQERLRQQAIDLKGWWYREMLATDSPLTERLTLFWHNHFTSGLRKVKAPVLLYRQNLLLRRHAAGNFRELLHAVARDPAMTLYLDNHVNRKDKPNENFARELLELFTLGEGHYSEQDIKEAARAFTGWTIDRHSGAFRFNLYQHDDGVKTFLGKSGKFDGDDILDILLEQPRTAEHVVEKLWREFVSDTPDPDEVRRLAQVFRASGYELRPLLEGLLTAPAFRDPKNRGTLVKSPAELIVGTLRMFPLPALEPPQLVFAGHFLGQDLFDPPNVKGWPGGTAWITSNTLLARQKFLDRVARAVEAPDPRGDDMPASRHDPSTLAILLLPLPPANTDTPAADATARARQPLLDPVYQLK
jgi:uncharacterized protein (DUF1800 family)